MPEDPACAGLLTLAVGLHAWRYYYRTLLLAASALMAGTGFAFALLTDFWPPTPGRWSWRAA